MAKRSGSVPRQPVITRTQKPVLIQDGKKAALMCPFCDPPHPLYPDVASNCGTVIDVNAVQTVWPARTTKREGMICLKCGKGLGEMVRLGDGFIHLKECSPTSRVLTKLPKYNPFARIVLALPRKVRSVVEKVTGEAQTVQEIDGSGNKTGKTLGYFFWSKDGRKTPVAGA